jgi:acetylornithine/succinyldiaminopimelate/putrescine aminotransferase
VSDKKPMVALQNGFHGRGYGSMAVSWRDDYKRGFFVDDSTTFVDPDVPLGPWADPQNWTQKGGLIIELVQGEAGCIPLDVDWVQALVGTAQSANVPVIVDEIQTGYGRTGTFTAQEQYGIRPDITCLGKAGGGGLPFGAVVSSVENFRALQTPPLSHISTFGGNAVVMAAGCAVMDAMTDELFAHVKRCGDLLRSRIGELAERYPGIISGVRGRGLMNGLLLANSDLSAPFHQACMQRGLMLFFKLNAGNVLRMSPALVISSEQINEAVTIMDQACQDLSRRP